MGCDAILFEPPVRSTEGMIFPKKYIEAKGKGFEREPIGTGPYKLLEQKEGDYIKLVAHKILTGGWGCLNTSMLPSSLYRRKEPGRLPYGQER